MTLLPLRLVSFLTLTLVAACDRPKSNITHADESTYAEPAPSPAPATPRPFKPLKPGAISELTVRNEATPQAWAGNYVVAKDQTFDKRDDKGRFTIVALRKVGAPDYVPLMAYIDSNQDVSAATFLRATRVVVVARTDGKKGFVATFYDENDLAYHVSAQTVFSDTE